MCLACKFSYGRKALPNILTQADIDKARKKNSYFHLTRGGLSSEVGLGFCTETIFVGLSAIATKLQENEG